MLILFSSIAMEPLFSEDPIVIQVAFRVTDKIKGYSWDIDENLRFRTPYPDLLTFTNDQIIGVEGVDVRHMSSETVKNMLQSKKFTKFTSIRVLKSGKGNHPSVVYSNNVITSPFLKG